LVGEIKTGHAARLSFVKGMRQEVATMREGFRRANDERVRDVTALLAGFRREHKERTREVMALRQEVAADLAGARRAWFGPSPAERRAMAAAERRAEAERLAKEAAERDRLAAEAMAKEEAARQQAAHETEEKESTPEPKGPAKKK
jgi:hypothetical protein